MAVDSDPTLAELMGENGEHVLANGPSPSIPKFEPEFPFIEAGTRGIGFIYDDLFGLNVEVCLRETENGDVYFSRLITKVGMVKFVPWTGELQLNSALLDSFLSKLSKQGYWDVSDFMASDMLDGDVYQAAVRATDVKSLTLYCPDERGQPKHYAIERIFQDLLWITPKQIKRRAWWAKVLSRIGK